MTYSTIQELRHIFGLLLKNKSPERQGKVQLVDASNMYEKRRKNIGEKE